MADNFNDMLVELFGAMDRITSSHVDKLKFDKTITAEIVSAANKEKGEYIVSDGSSTFKAFSENTSYNPGTWVYVQIPNGDFNNQKIITGKYINNNTEYYTYTPDLDSYVDITKNLIDGDRTSTGLVANGSKTQVVIWEDTNFSHGMKYDKLGLKGEFRTWLSSAKTTDGNYGLRLDVISEDMNTSQVDPSYKLYTFKLDSDNFYGDVYNFETYYQQEVVFDISHIRKIVSLRLVFYQDGNFINEKGREVAGFLEDGTELDANIFIQNPFVSLGYDLKSFDTDKVLLYTLDSQTYSTFLSDDTKKDIYSKLSEENKAEIVAIEAEKAESDVSFDGSILELNNEYASQFEELGNLYEIGSEDYFIKLDELNAWYNEEQEKLIAAKKLSDTFYKQRLQLIYNLIELNNPNTFTADLNSINSKDIQLRWVHKDEDDKIRVVDSIEDMPIGSKIHWYQYVLEDGIYDELAGPFWKEVFPGEAENAFAYEGFIPNPQNQIEQFKVIIECLSQEYIDNELIYNDNRIIELDRLIESGEATEEEKEERASLASSYYEQLNYYISEPLTFENESAVPDLATISLIKGLEIVCDENGYKGVYNIYNENGNIMAQSEAVKTRILSAKYNTLVTGQDMFDTAEKITWRIPIHNTMIVEPAENVEYRFYDPAYVMSEEELDFNIHYTRNSNGEYIKVAEGDSYSVENLYFVKNNTEIIRNDAEGYIDIIRYGVVSSREAGTEEADSIEQYFRIKPFYTQSATNNKVYCIVNKNNRDYTAEYEMHFAPTGNNGTNYTFTLEFENNVPAMTWDDIKENRKSIKVIPKVYNYEREDITEQFSGFIYSWESFGGGGLLTPVKDEVSKSAIISFAEQVLENNVARDITIEDCNYYILKAAVKANIEIEENKVAAELVEKPEGEDHETEPLDIPEVSKREVTLTAYLPISIRRSDKWVSFNGVDKICYDLTGTNPNYYKDKNSLYWYNTETKITEKDETVQWSISLGIDTGYLDSLEDLKKQKIYKYYPITTPDGFVTVPSLFMHDNGKQLSIVAKSADENGEYIEWIQPIRVYQDSYSSSMLNSWDGSLTIDEENGKILSTMMGAGKKDSENRFSGVLMGDVSVAGENEGSIAAEADQTAKELAEYYSGIGLYGYNSGVKSFGMNINGKAFFGKPGNGQILIDGNSGSIQSRNYIQTKRNDDKPVVDEDGNVVLNEDGKPIIEPDHDKSGMIIDLDRGSINAYGEGTAAAVTIDPTPANEYKPIFEVKSSKGKELLFVGDNRYYLQSDDYVKEKDSTDPEQKILGQGINFDLCNGKLDAYNFNLKAENSSGDRYTGSYVQIDSDGSPYLQVRHKDSEGTGLAKTDANGIDLINISKNQFKLHSQDWDGTSAGTQIDLGSNGAGITSYKFKLEAGTSPNKIIINSGAGTYPLEIGKSGNFNVTWNGTLTCNGASIIKASVTEATLDSCRITGTFYFGKNGTNKITPQDITFVTGVSLSATAAEINYLAQAWALSDGIRIARWGAEFIRSVSLTYSTRTVETLCSVGNTSTGLKGGGSTSGAPADRGNHHYFHWNVTNPLNQECTVSVSTNTTH